MSLTNPANPASAVDGLVDLLPPEAQRLYQSPVPGAQGTAAVIPGPGSSATTGLLMTREGFCEHVTVVEGRCAQASGEVVVSEADAGGLGYSPGTDLRFAGEKPTSESTTPIGTLKVVGVYRQTPAPYWFGKQLTGISGLKDQSSQQRVQHDAWLTPAATFQSRDLPRLPEFAVNVDLALETQQVGIDELFALNPTLERLHDEATTTGVSVKTGLPDIALDVDDQRTQARVTIPLLMVQLALLVLVVFWLVLDILTEQRRPELAIAMLHGSGRRGARLRLAGELLPAVVAGAVAGLAVAAAACAAATSWFLPGEASVELRGDAALAAGGSLLCLVALCVLAARRVTRVPINTLLRSVGTRRTGWGFTATETLVLVASGTLVVAFVAGWLTGPVALAGPMLLALVVGLSLAHALVPAAAAVGHRAMSRGRLLAGVSTLGVARRPRRLVVPSRSSRLPPPW